MPTNQIQLGVYVVKDKTACSQFAKYDTVRVVKVTGSAVVFEADNHRFVMNINAAAKALSDFEFCGNKLEDSLAATSDPTPANSAKQKNTARNLVHAFAGMTDQQKQEAAKYSGKSLEELALLSETVQARIKAEEDGDSFGLF